jgi:antitoxin YefM
MPAAEHVPLAEVQSRLSEVVDRLERGHGRVVITKDGRQVAVMLSLEDLESLEETLAVLSDPGLATAIAEADAEVAAGGATRRSQQEALAEIERGPSRPGRRSRPTGGHRADTYRRA